MTINRRDFVKLSTGTAAVGLTGLTSSELAPSVHAEPLTSTSWPTSAKRVFSPSIREYLSREAQRITSRPLSDYKDAVAWRRLVSERRRQFLEMMGLEALPSRQHRDPPKATITGVVERPQYRIEKLYYESWPRLYVTANLYVPNRLSGPAPAVLYVCGHSPNQKVHYQAHPRRFAELGFICLIVETVQLGEAKGYHHGPYYEGWFHWYSRGYTPAGIELLNGIRGLDLLESRSDVDAKRLGVTGISGGGATTWWVAAADQRIQAAAPVCGTATLASHIEDLTVDGHCDCMWWINTYRWDLADVGGLIAPRPLLIASSDHDDIFTIASIRKVHTQLKPIFQTLGAAENLRLVVTPGGHGYHRLSRTAIFSWFVRHLQGKEVPPEQVGDIDEFSEKQEAEETLRVFVNGSPPENRTPHIHEDFFVPPESPRIMDRGALDQARRDVIAALKKKTFGAFPPSSPPLDVEVEYEFQNDGSKLKGSRFAFYSDGGWRLEGRLTMPGSVLQPMPAVVALRSPDEKRDGTGGATEEFLGDMRVPWAKVIVGPRGTGETAWGEELQWHLRRAAVWTGRTLASMRVYDTLRALEAARSLPLIDARRVALAARGEMAAVALYAALLDGRVTSLILEAPPATQNAPSQRDGRGPALEMLNCLCIADLPQVAGLLFPAELVFVRDCPSTYDWAEELYRRLGAPEKFQRVKELSAWQRAERPGDLGSGLVRLGKT